MRKFTEQEHMAMIFVFIFFGIVFVLVCAWQLIQGFERTIQETRRYEYEQRLLRCIEKHDMDLCKSVITEIGVVKE